MGTNGTSEHTAETPHKAPLTALTVGSGPTAIVPRDIDQVWRVAEIVFKSGMVPRDFKTKEQITVAIMHGLEIGLSPMQALQRIAVINGRPSVWGEAVPALALRTGLVEDWVERIDGEGDQMVATCTVKRKGIRSAIERTFSVADAKRAGLWGKAGPWTQYPKRMLQMRARVAFRDGFADAMGGLYIAEEVIGIDEPKDITPKEVVTPPPEGGKKELPPLAKPAPQTFKSTAVIEGEIVNGPPPKKNGNGKKQKPLPPMAAEARPPTVMTDEEAEKAANVMIDQLDFAETETSIAAWVQNNVPTMHRLPKEKRDRVETAFNLKQATIQKGGKGEG